MRSSAQARLTVTTSHYAELKEWASAADGAANAATAIDPDSSEPLYTVTLGRPGTSHALQTAERLGLPRDDRRGCAGLDRPRAAAGRRARRGGRGGGARGAGRSSPPPPRSGRRRRRHAGRPQRAAEGLQDEIEQVRSSAAAERQRALDARPRRS